MHSGSFFAAACAVVMVLSPARAETVWELINEYPATALAGEADIFFADAVRQKTSNLTIRPIHDAKSGLRTREQLKAVTDGRFAMASSFGGALGDEDPIFLLSSLPFVTPSAEAARVLYEAALPLYAAVLAQRKQKLLYVSPWPPSGIWSADPVGNIAALHALKLRTYDKTSTEVFAQVAASATVISFADLNPRLAAGEVNAVLSSGDGGAGRQLWKYLRNFTEITYAIPLSFGTVSLAAFEALTPAERAAVEAAGRETTARQWASMAGRVARNFAVMRQNGVAIEERPSSEVLDALRTAAAKSVAEWRQRAGTDAAKVLDDFRARATR